MDCSGCSSGSDRSIDVSGVDSAVNDPGIDDLALSLSDARYSSIACLPRALTLSVCSNSSFVSSSFALCLVVTGMVDRT